MHDNKNLHMLFATNHVTHEQCVTLTRELYLYATLEAQWERFGIPQLIDQHLKHQLHQLSVTTFA